MAAVPVFVKQACAQRACSGHGLSLPPDGLNLPKIMPEPMIVTERLELAYPQREDFADLWPILSDAGVMALAFSGGKMDRPAAQEFFLQTFDWQRTGKAPGILRERSTGRVIGFAGLKVCHVLDADDLELGFVLAREVWGRGYATEIGEAQLQHGFGVLGCSRLLGLVAPQNAASRRTLEKIGMSLHGKVDMAERGARLVMVRSRPD